MKLTAKTIDTINLRLEKVKEFITVNNGEDLDNIKDELFEIVQQRGYRFLSVGFLSLSHRFCCGVFCCFSVCVSFSLEGAG